MRLNLRPGTRGLCLSMTLALLAYGAGGCATTGTDPGRAGFNRIDLDGDNTITEDEFATHLIHESFQMFDTNRDRVIQFDEWRAKETEAGAVALFETLDLDSNGQLGFEEFDSSDRKREALGRMFHTLDRNDDGRLDWLEVRGR